MSEMTTRKRRRDSKLVRISSRDRSAPSTTNKYNFDISFDDYFLHQIQHVIVKSILIPNTQYNINSNNNTLFYDYNGTGVSSITVTPGQYDITSFMTALDAAIVAAGDVCTTTQDPTTLKLTLTFGANTIMYGPADQATTMHEVLGFEFTTANAAAQVMPGLPDLSGLKKVYIKSNKLSNGVAMSNSEKKHVNVFTEVDIDQPFGGIVHRVLDDLHTSDEVTNAQPKNISTLDIELLDENLNTVDLNNHEFEILLKVFN